MSRKTLKISSATKQRLDKVKRDGETHDALIGNLIDESGRDPQPEYPKPTSCAECGDGLDKFTIVDGTALCLECAGIKQ